MVDLQSPSAAVLKVGWVAEYKWCTYSSRNVAIS